MPIDLSIVVPVYRCDECLRALYDRVTRTVSELTSDYELVFVDDRSPDAAWTTVRELAALDPRVRAVRLSRNFGQQAAITAGLAVARGKWVVVMDCDLQDPPEDIPRLYRKALEGYDVVIGRRTERPQGYARRALTSIYLKARRRLTGVPFEGVHSNFSIISRKVVSAFLRVGDRHRAYLLILYWLGFETTTIEFTPAARYAGTSSYTFRDLARVAIDGILFETTLVLRWLVYFGFAVAITGAGLAAYLLFFYFTNNPYPGWTSIAVGLLLIGGFIIISTGVTGLYIGRVFEQTKNRPVFVIDDVIDSNAVSDQPQPSGELTGVPPADRPSR